MDAPPTGITTPGRAACPAGSCSDRGALISKYIGPVNYTQYDAPNTTLGSSSAANEDDSIGEEVDALLSSFGQDNPWSNGIDLQDAGVLHRFQCLKTAPAHSTERPVLQQLQQFCLPLHHAASHVKVSNMPSPHDIQPPPQAPPAAYPINLNAQVFGAASACPAVSNSVSGTTSASAADDNFTFPCLEIKQKNQVPSAAFYADRYKLTSPSPVRSHNSPRSGLQHTLDVSTSNVNDNGGSRARSFLAFVESKSLSPAAILDSATTKFSTRSMPINMLPNDSMLQPQEGRGNLSMAPSLSANKAEGHPSTTKKERRSSAAAGHAVAFNVKTQSADLDDGYQWLKYGEKTIKNEKYRKSYFHCDKKKGCGCEVKKHTQKCADDEECFEFVYLGRHNHPRDEQNVSATRKRDRQATRKLLG